MTKNKLFFQQMKLACVIPLVLVSLTSFPQRVRAKLVESALLNHGMIRFDRHGDSEMGRRGELYSSERFINNSPRHRSPLSPRHHVREIISTISNASAHIHFAQLPKLPDNGAPTGRRRGGTSRNGCPTLNTPITALVPGEETPGSSQAGTESKIISKSFLASTVAEHPTFWFYVPELPAHAQTGEFVLQKAEDDVYRTTLVLPQKPGVISISLPQNPQYSLKTNNKYHWYFKVYCGNPQETPEYFYVDGEVQRVALTRTLESQLNTAKSGEYKIYAANNIWYDALTNLAELRRTDSQNPMLVEDWANLLKSVGLQDLAQAPIVQRYKEAPTGRLPNQYFSVKGQGGKVKGKECTRTRLTSPQVPLTFNLRDYYHHYRRFR